MVQIAPIADLAVGPTLYGSREDIQRMVVPLERIMIGRRSFRITISKACRNAGPTGGSDDGNQPIH